MLIRSRLVENCFDCIFQKHIKCTSKNLSEKTRKRKNEFFYANVLDGIAQDKNVNKLDSFLKKLHM